MPVPRISRREQLHAALRPAEAVELRLSNCDLPETGWGTLTLRETRPVSGKQWADSGGAARPPRPGGQGDNHRPPRPHPAHPGFDPPGSSGGVQDCQEGAGVR